MKTAGLPLFAGIFFFINVLFVVKYGVRAGIPPVAGVAGYAVFLLALFAVAGLLSHLTSRLSARGPRAYIWPVALAAAYVLVALIVYLRMDPENLNIDRWSALDHFLRALFRGEYPYQALSHMGNPISGFPGLFLLALPFYALGDVGLLQFGALLAFAVMLALRFREGARPVFLLTLLIAMPVFQYQVFCRSDLFGNMVAVAWVLFLCLRPGAARGGRLLLWGIAWGLLLSTRAIVIVPLILAAFPLLHGRSAKDWVAFGAVVSVTFFATFVPFYLWNPALFAEHNPYSVQSGYASRPVLAAVLAVCAFLGWRYRAAPRTFLHTGLALFGTITLCWILRSLQMGWGPAFWQHYFDVTYFVMCVPFLLFALGERLSRAPAELS